MSYSQGNITWNNFFVLFDCKVPNLPKQQRTLLTRNLELSALKSTQEKLLPCSSYCLTVPRCPRTGAGLTGLEDSIRQPHINLRVSIPSQKMRQDWCHLTTCIAEYKGKGKTNNCSLSQCCSSNMTPSQLSHSAMPNLNGSWKW